MMIVQVTIREDRPMDVAKRRWNEWCRAAYLKMAKWWYDNILPLHFTKQAPTRYSHKPRSAKYLRHKRKKAAQGKVKYGGLIDNVYTGAMEEMLRSVAEIRAYPTRAVLSMTGPRYMTMTPFTGDRSKGYRYGKNRSQVISKTAGQQPDKVAEITRVTADEAQILSNILTRAIVDQMEQYKSPRTTVIKAA